MMRPALMMLGLSIACVGIAACGSPQATPEATASVSASTTTAPELPDGIPLPVGGSVIDGPNTSKESQATGWSAVALASPTADVASVSAELTQELQAAGWVDEVSPTADAGMSISATRTVGDTTSWLNVNVTPPLPEGGSAVTYRFATGQTPSLKGGGRA